MPETYAQATQYGKRNIVVCVRYENQRGEWREAQSVRLSDHVQTVVEDAQQLRFKLTDSDKVRLLGEGCPVLNAAASSNPDSARFVPANPRLRSGNLSSWYRWMPSNVESAEHVARQEAIRQGRFTLTVREPETRAEQDAVYYRYYNLDDARVYPKKVRPLVIGTGRNRKAVVIYTDTAPPGRCRSCGKAREVEWFPEHLDRHDAPLAGGYYDQEDVPCTR